MYPGRVQQKGNHTKQSLGRFNIYLHYKFKYHIDRRFICFWFDPDMGFTHAILTL